jgi:bifunctional non-homologous end joining protein LigD
MADHRWVPTPSAVPADRRRTPWRNSPPSRRAPPAGFIIPCQPDLVACPPARPGWLHEMKEDGYRLIARKDTNRVTLWSRYATDFTDKLPRIAEAVRALPVDNALIDGEAVVFRPVGHSDFVALRTKAGGELASFVAFDLLSLKGRDLRQQPLADRREALEQLVAGLDSIQFSTGFVDDGAVVFAHACKLGLEGIVSKRVLGRYHCGTSSNWLKRLNPEFKRR